MKTVHFATAVGMLACLAAGPLSPSPRLQAAAQNSAAQGSSAQAVPSARYVRYFAEGSTGFFDTTVAVLNPSPTETAHVTLSLLVESGGTVSHALTLGPRQRQTISINEVLGTSAAVSIIVESDVPVAADRWMTWGSTGIGASLGIRRVEPAGDRLVLRRGFDRTVLPYVPFVAESGRHSHDGDGHVSPE